MIRRLFCLIIVIFVTLVTGKQLDQYTPTQGEEEAPSFPESDDTIPQDPESLIVAMERVTVLFDR